MMVRIGLLTLPVLLAACGLGDDRKDPNNPFGESDTSPTLERNRVQAAILNDWRRVREPEKASFHPMPAAPGIVGSPEGKMRCSADQAEIQTYVLRDPADYNPGRAREVALFCPKHGAYWIDLQRGENGLHQVYGPFRLGP